MATVILQSDPKMYLFLSLMIVCWSYASGQVESADCPAGFILLNTTCYYFSERSVTRGAAQEACESVGATLAALSTPEEDTTVVTYLNTLGGAIHYWIGITQIDALHFEWVDGSPLESPNWGDRFDPHDERTNCIRMDSTLDWQWYDKSCGFSYNYICEAPLAGNCSSVFPSSVQFGSSCYTNFNAADEPKTYPQTKDICESYNGSYVVTLNTQDERLFVEGLAETLNYTRVWLGLTQPDYPNFKWMNEEVFGYTRYVSAPYFYGSDCFRMSAWDEYKWTDRLCSAKNHFICEWEAPQEEESVKIRKFRVGRKNSVPITSNTLSHQPSPNLVRCGSSCISNSNCSSFAYNEDTRDCVLAGPLNQVNESTGSTIYYLQENTPEDSDKRIFVSDEQGRKLWMADILKMEFREIPIPVTFPIKATYDPVKGYAYVAQSDYLLSRITLDGSYQQWLNLSNEVEDNIVRDLSLDVRSRRLYVAVSPLDHILEYDIDADDPTPSTFYYKYITSLRAVHAVSEKGHVYFGHSNTIKRVDIDGRNHKVIFQGTPLIDVRALTVDIDSGKIFIADADMENILSVNLDGSNPEFFLLEPMTVRGLGYHAGLLYWTDDDSNLRVSFTSRGSTITQEGGPIFADARTISIM